MRLTNFLNEKKTKFDVLNKWKSDLRRLTKIYKDIDSEDKFNEAQHIFGTFSKNFENWVFKELLKNDKRTILQKEIRTKGWQAVVFIGSGELFPTYWYYKTNKYHPDLDKLKKNKQKNINKYNRLFREFFKVAEEYFEQDYTQEITPKEHIVNKQGINFIISKDAPKGEYIDKFFNKVLPKVINLLKSRGLGKILKDLNVKIERSVGSTGSGDTAGATYDMNKDIVNLSQWAMLEVGTLIHELGHRLYFKLPPNTKAYWDDVMHQLTGNITRDDFKEFFDVYGDEIYDNYDQFKTNHIKDIKIDVDDLVKRYKFEFIRDNLKRVTFHNLHREDLYKELRSRVVNKRLHLGFNLDDYATTNSWEGFAEAFKFFVVQPNKLNWFIRTLLIKTMRSGGYRINENDDTYNKIKIYLNGVY